ncbi:MAG: PaaI family thioesterase [Nitrospirota bacterium]|nr:PaaI family thioesterase [Nitrospirota bacterium]
MDLRDTKNCFVCGNDNPLGLKVRFELNKAGRTASGIFQARKEHEGFENVIHGGVIAAVLDEAMVKLARHCGIPAVSAEITVKFKAPAAPGDELSVTARILSETKRLIETEATISRGPVVISEATGKLLRIK